MPKLLLVVLLFVSSAGFGQIEIVSQVNSSADELAPVISPDGKSLYFIRRFDANNAGGMRDPGDIWVSQLGDSAWNVPKRVSSIINNKQFNGIIGFQSDAEVYLYEHYKPGGAVSKSQGISFAAIHSKTIPSRVDVKYFYNKSDHISIAFSPMGNVMILALESYGTIGAEDLYVSFKSKENEWSEPKNIGSVINTSFQEMTPYIAPDNSTLFFASNGHDGFGGRDIFMTKRLDDTWRNWTVPINLGPKVNTEGVELYFQYLPEVEKAFFTSTTNSDGHSDLKVVDLPEKELEQMMGDTLNFEPKITELAPPIITESKDPPARFVLTGNVLNESGEKILADIKVSRGDWSLQIPSDPNYSIELPEEGIYEVVIESDGYVSRQDILDLRVSEIKSWKHNFTLQRIEIGVTVSLDNVLFAQGSTELLDLSEPQLDLIVAMMATNPGMKIELSGHTDNQGSERLNKTLSSQRVDGVIKYLVDHGVDGSRLSGQGYGGSQPIASNESEETRKLNRRVEFIIIAK